MFIIRTLILLQKDVIHPNENIEQDVCLSETNLVELGVNIRA